MLSRNAISGAFRAAVLLIAAVSAPVFAMSRQISDEELVRSSSVVVDARVKQVTPHWNQDRSLIFTTVQISVAQILYARGNPPGSSLEFEVLGGELDGVGLTVSEAPEFRLGERVLVFVRPWTQGRLVLSGGPSGLIRVDESGIVHGRGVSVKQFGSQIRGLAR